MSTVSIDDVRGLFNQARKESFEGFSVSLEDDRAFMDVIQGEVGTNLYGYNVDDSNVDLNSFLSGREIGVFSDGKKLFETVLKGGENLEIGSSWAEFDFKALDSSSGIPDIKDVFPSQVVNSLPKKMRDGNVRSLARNLDIDSLTFKPVRESPTVTDTKEKVQSMGGKSFILVLGLVVGLYTVYRGIKEQ